MKYITFLFFLLNIVIYLFIVTWNILACLTEMLVNNKDDNHPIDNHLAIGGNDSGEDVDMIKRAGSHYLSDRNTAIYDRNIRH